MEGETGIRTNLIPADYFSNLGVVAAHGRLVDSRDAAPEAPSAGVLGYDFWQTHFGGDPGVIGRVLRINQQPGMGHWADGLVAAGLLVEEGRTFTEPSDLISTFRS